MSKEKVVFNVGSFVDFDGGVREVVFAAVSKFENFVTVDEEGKNTVIPLKAVHIGVSAQNPGDSFADTVLGKRIAEGKAKKAKSCKGTIFSTDPGMINRAVVEALLEQEMEYFKQNPGKYLAGYNRDRDLYKKDPELYYKKYNL